MDLRLTITRVGDGRSEDVTVTATDRHTAADLLAGLLEVLGGEGVALHSGGRPIEASQPVGVPPLVDGASVTIASLAPAPAPPQRERARAALVLDVVSGPDCGHTLALTPGRHTIGRDPRCSLVIADSSISREHAAVEVSSAGVRLSDLGATNPARRLDTGATDGPLAPHDEIQVGATRLRARPVATRPLSSRSRGDGSILVHRSPHVPGPPIGSRLELPARPSSPVPPRVPWLALLLPIPVCAVLALLWGPQLLAFALLGPLVGGSSALAERRSGRRRYAAQLAEHAGLRAAVAATAGQVLAADLAARHRAHPDPAELARAAREPSSRLWERRATDPPVVRLGVGPVTSRVLLIDPDRAGADVPELLADAPVTVDLSQTAVLGIAGPVPRAESVARCLLTQLVTLHSPDDLRVRVLTEPEGDAAGPVPADRSGSSARDQPVPAERTGSSAWTRWLPHNATAQSRGAARPGGSPGPSADAAAAPWTVSVVHPTAGRARAVAAVREVVGHERQVAIVLAEHVEDLPAACSAVLELGADPAQTVLSLPGAEPSRGIVVDGVSAAWAERVARCLAPLRDAGCADRELPATVTFATTHPDLADGWTVSALAARWAAPPAGLAAVVGVGEQGPLSVDLVRHGPHAVVGGTTGAGKSELLRALVTGMAAAQPPESVTFLLIDYKGGAAFRDCARLPHTVGVVTDLDAHLAQRALVSLTAEVRRREQLLAAVGASNLADHDRLRGPGDERLPRLVIVVDEFKMLIEERPEFVEGMVRLAAVGRSLGIHLVLATQRPAGAITADIQANVNLRIALRVRDRQDSEGVIEAPDAALLPESTPGRALLSTGTGRLVAFQAAHVGSRPQRADVTLRIRRGLGPRRPTPRDADSAGDEVTELGLFVDLARATSMRDGHPAPRAPWLPALPASVSLDDLLGTAATGGAVPLGLLDVPERQAQPLWSWSPTEPTVTGIVGAAGSGRSSLVRTLVTGLGDLATPVHAYVVGGGGALTPLALLPWVGAVVADDDRVRLRRLLDLLCSQIRRRTEELTHRGLTTLTEWQLATPDEAPPTLLLVVDGWDAIAEPTGGLGADLDAMVLADDLRTVIETGGAAGLRTVLAGGRSLLLGRGARLCTETVVLGRLDPTDAILAGLPGRDTSLPPPPPGRGVRRSDGATLQVAHLGVEPSGAAQSVVVAACARAALDAAPGSRQARPFPVGQLPERVQISDLPPGSPFVVGLDRDGMPCGFDPAVDGRRLLVAGPRRSGRTSVLLTIAQRCAAVGRPVVLVSGQRQVPAAAVAGLEAVWVIGPQDHEALVGRRRAHPDLVVLVDDADQLVGSPVEPALVELLGLLDRDDGVLVATVEPHGLARLVRGVAVEVASRRTGILLAPTGRADGDWLGVRVPGVLGPIRPGRGHLVARGVVHDVQVAVPTGSEVRGDPAGTAGRADQSPLGADRSPLQAAQSPLRAAR